MTISPEARVARDSLPIFAGAERDYFVCDQVREHIALKKEEARLLKLPDPGIAISAVRESMDQIVDNLARLVDHDPTSLTEAKNSLSVARDTALQEGQQNFIANVERMRKDYPTENSLAEFLDGYQYIGIIHVIDLIDDRITDQRRREFMDQVRQRALQQKKETERKRTSIVVDLSERKENGEKTVRINDQPLTLTEPGIWVLTRTMSGSKLKRFKDLASSKDFANLCNIEHSADDLSEALDKLHQALQELTSVFSDGNTPDLSTLLDIQIDTRDIENSTIRRRENVRALSKDLLNTARVIGGLVTETAIGHFAHQASVKFQLEDLFSDISTGPFQKAKSALFPIIFREILKDFNEGEVTIIFDDITSELTLRRESSEPQAVAPSLVFARNSEGEVCKVTAVGHDSEMQMLEQSILIAIANNGSEATPLNAKQIRAKVGKEYKLSDIKTTLARMQTIFSSTLHYHPGDESKKLSPGYFIKEIAD